LFDSILNEFKAQAGPSCESSDMEYTFGVLFAVLGDRERAIGYLESALGAKPDHAAARYCLGVLHGDAGNYRDAVRELERARATFPMTVHLARELGRALGGLGEVDAAVATYRAAIERAGAEGDTYLLRQELGRLYHEQKKYAQSAEELELARRRNPSDPSLRVNLGAAYLGGGRLEDAAAEFEAALAIKPDLLSALRNLGVLYLRSGRLEDAVGVLSRAAILDPGDARTHRRLALACHARGMEEEAERHMRAALEIESNAGRSER